MRQLDSVQGISFGCVEFEDGVCPLLVVVPFVISYCYFDPHHEG